MHQLRTCGIENVWLVNGYRYRASPYGPTTSIDDVHGLYGAIARAVVAKPLGLNAAEVRFLRIHMEMSQEALASKLGADVASVARWEQGRSALPRPVDRLLRLISVGEDNGRARLRPAIDALTTKLPVKNDDRLVFVVRDKAWIRLADAGP
jgi:putative transcriptional regulator